MSEASRATSGNGEVVAVTGDGVNDAPMPLRPIAMPISAVLSAAPHRLHDSEFVFRGDTARRWKPPAPALVTCRRFSRSMSAPVSGSAPR